MSSLLRCEAESTSLGTRTAGGISGTSPGRLVDDAARRILTVKEVKRASAGSGARGLGAGTVTRTMELLAERAGTERHGIE